MINREVIAWLMIHNVLRGRSFPRLLLYSILIMAACGGRSVGTASDGQPDHWVPPNPDGYCMDLTEQLLIQDTEEPAFVHSMDRTTGNRYVVGVSGGWNEPSAQLMMLDSNTLALLGSVGVDAETVHARFDQWTGEVVALAEADNGVWYLRYIVIASMNLDLIDERFLCDQCVAAWGGPETVEVYAGAAIRDLTDNRIRVFVMPRDEPGVMYESVAIEGTSPQLVANGDNLLLLYLHDQQLWDRELDRSAGLTEPDQQTVSPTQGLLGAGSYSGVVGAAVLTATSPPRLEIFVWSYGGDQNPVSVPVPLNTPVEGSVTFSGGTVGVVWGQTLGEVGAYIVGGEPSSFVGGEPSLNGSFGPYRVSDPVDQSSSSYSLRAATCYHNDGYAVVWGGWDEDEGYGIYGKIVSCSPGQ